MRPLTLIALLLVVLAAPAASGAQAAPRASLPDIEDEVMCPVCGTPLNTAESPQASRERAFIRDLIAKGATKEQIKAALVDEFGTAVLALPDEDEGVGAAAYLVPIGLVAGLAVLLAFALPRWRRRRPAPSAPAAAPLSAADRTRVEEELARFDR